MRRTILIVAAFVLGGCNALLGNAEAGPQDESKSGSDDTAAKDGGSDSTTKPPAKTNGGETNEQPPYDFTCGTWTLPELQTNENCKQRRAQVIRKGVRLPSALAIERTREGGRLGVAVHDKLSENESRLLLDQFVPTSDPSKLPKITMQAFDAGPFAHCGMAAALAPFGSSNFHLIYQTEQNGEIRYVPVNDKGPIGNAEVIANGITAATTVSLAASTTTDDLLATYFDPKAGSLYSRVRTSTGFASRSLVEQGFVSNGLPGAGQSSAAFDESNHPAVAYHRVENLVASQPMFNELVDTTWSGAKEIEVRGNNMRGYSIALGIYKNRHYVAYFSADSAGKRFSLNFASWENPGDNVSPVVLIREIYVNDALVPHANVAMAIDRFGLVHIAAVVPNGPHTSIHYIRQTGDVDKSWLDDDVDEAITPVGASSTWVDAALVDIAIDEKSRPHIVYHLNTDDSIHYASYFDR